MNSPQVAARYQVVQEIGSGGTGRVFRARDTRLGRDVALKRLLPALAADPIAVERFLREGRAAAAFSHAHAVHVYDADRDEEGPFIALELVRGGSLADVIKDGGPLSAHESVRLIRQVGEALAAAHGAGMVHRDVKPSNVLLDERGSPKLTDFGLALFEGRGELTRSLMGTPEYMAPEQGTAPEKVDARADVFSLAATLYACLTGEPPRLIRESLVPAELRPVLLKALAADPAQRYPNMQAFLAALDRAGGPRARRARTLYLLKWLGAAASVLSLAFALFRLLPSRAEAPREAPRSSRVRVDLPSPTSAARPAEPPPVASGRAPKALKVEAAYEQVTIHKSVIDSGYALGFVVNKGEVPLENAHVELRLYDEAGSLVQAASGYSSAQRIEPGAKFPVTVLLKPFPRFQRYEAKVQDSGLGYAQPSVKLETVESKLEPDRFLGWSLFAKVRNADERPCSYPQVSAVLYDEAGTIVGMGDGFLASKELGPGEVSTATLRITAYGKQPPSRYELYLFGSPK